MKYHVSAEKACNNLVHNIKKIEDAMVLEEITEGYSDRWVQLSKVKQQCFKELGAWYYIDQTIK